MIPVMASLYYPGRPKQYLRFYLRAQFTMMIVYCIRRIVRDASAGIPGLDRASGIFLKQSVLVMFMN